MKCEWNTYTVQQLIDMGMIESPMDGNHGAIHPKASDYVSNGVPFIMANDLVNGKINYHSCAFITEAQAATLRKGFSKPGDVLLTHKATIGRTAIVSDEYDTIILTPQVTYYRVIKGLNRRYLKYYFDSSAFQHLFSNWAGAGSTRAYLGITAQRKLPIIVPPIEIQDAIADICGSLDDKIELNNKINENLERQAQSIYHERFETINKDELPVGWRVVALGDIAVISKKSFNPSKEPETMLEHYSIPAFDESHFPVFELSTAIKSNKFVVDDDCFMISKLNPTIKRVWRPYCLTENAVCSTEFIVYKAKDRTITDFLYSVIDSVSFSDFMCSHVTGSTGSRQRTTPSDTLSFEFVLPSEDDLNSFQALISPMYTQIRNNAIENDKLKRLRDSLLPKLMSGEIDVEDVNI